MSNNNDYDPQKAKDFDNTLAMIKFFAVVAFLIWFIS